MKLRKMCHILLILLAVLLLIWSASLIKCEVLTTRHKAEFDVIGNFPVLLSEKEFIKVLAMNDRSAKIYYVEEDMLGGHLLFLDNDNGVWSAYQWDTIWSGNGGSASGIVYPYFWHVIYGGI